MSWKPWALPDHPLLTKIATLWNATSFLERWPGAFVTGSEIEKITQQAQREREKFVRMLELARLEWDRLSAREQRDALTPHPIGSQDWEVKVARLFEGAMDALDRYRALAARKAELDRLTIEASRKAAAERDAIRVREAEAHAAKKRALRERMVASKEARDRAEAEHRSGLFDRIAQRFAREAAPEAR